MYGTVARIQVQPGQEAALLALHDRWLSERNPRAIGFIAEYALRSDRAPGEWILFITFDSEEHYRQNAADPDQHRQYEELRALLAADPDWTDGEILAMEPASMSV